MRRHGMPFSSCYLRDADSVEFARSELGWTCSQSHDFVDPSFIRQLLGFGEVRPPLVDTGRLGIAVRSWPGLSAAGIAGHVESLAERAGCESVSLYVLEARNNSGPDVQFIGAVRALIQRPSRVRVYKAAELIDFVRDLGTCSIAISMKLHSSAIWAAFGVPQYPILYAPKVAAYFGRPFKGLEVMDVETAPADAPKTIPRSYDVAREWLSQPATRPAHPDPFTMVETVRYQTCSFAYDVGHKVRRLW
jgi:polysaccharide pyruvyl transferase WcaK-like protein